MKIIPLPVVDWLDVVCKSVRLEEWMQSAISVDILERCSGVHDRSRGGVMGSGHGSCAAHLHNNSGNGRSAGMSTPGGIVVNVF